MTGFTPSGATTRMRLVKSSAQPWTPLPYMGRAVDFLASRSVAGLPLLPGGRKTSITLAAFETLRCTGRARTMLVIAPLRVCRQTWRQEGAKWEEFKHLSFALLHGSKKEEALKSGADIYLINPEGIPWLSKKYWGRALPFDVVVIDELTKFQNSQAERSKLLRPRLKGVAYRWGLTGSLFAKGPMSVFGQQLILDDGAALGRYFTHFRDKFFHVGFDGFSYDLLPGADRRITDTLADSWFYMNPSDYAQLPPLVDVPHIGEMDKPQRVLYTRMLNDMLIRLPQGMVTASNAGACYSKLAQMANGAVYTDDHNVALIHDIKIDMLDEIVEELNGEPILVAYEFNHDLQRLKEWYLKRTGEELPYLGNGTTAKQEAEWVPAWNARKLPVLAAHPQSAGHGLNMQEGQAYNVAQFSITWDWENYDQFIRRVRRSGNTQARIFNHLLIIKGTIDEDKLAAVTEKDFTERRLMTALNSRILQEEDTSTGEVTMVAKLSRPGDNTGGNSGQASQQTQAPAGGGWGKPQATATVQQAPQQEPQQQAGSAGWGRPPNNEQQEQRQAIQERIAPQDRSADSRASFSGAVAEQANQIANGDYTTQAGPEAAPFEGGTQQAAPTTDNAPKPRSRAKNAEAPAGPSSEMLAAQLEAAAAVGYMAARSRIMSALIASSGPDDSVDDLVGLAREFMDFVERG